MAEERKHAETLRRAREVAENAARVAGALLRENLGKPRHITYKGDINLVTEADRQSEELITRAIAEVFPEHQILAEEGSRGGDQETYKWLIDPLDGTTNYAHGYPCFAVSIALEVEGEIGLGVVYQPVLDEMFVAQRGQGAWLNGRRLRVTDQTELIRGFLCTGFPYDVHVSGANLGYWANFLRRAQAVRRDGSAAIDLAYLAAGRFDGFWEQSLKPWDTAAGVLLVVEAGGVITNYRGEPYDVYQPAILASNGSLHEAMLDVLAWGDQVVGPGRGAVDIRPEAP